MAKIVLQNRTSHEIRICLAEGDEITNISIPEARKDPFTGKQSCGFAEIEPEFLQKAKDRSPVVAHWLRAGDLVECSRDEIARQQRAEKKGKPDESN